MNAKQEAFVWGRTWGAAWTAGVLSSKHLGSKVYSCCLVLFSTGGFCFSKQAELEWLQSLCPALPFLSLHYFTYVCLLLQNSLSCLLFISTLHSTLKAAVCNQLSHFLTFCVFGFRKVQEETCLFVFFCEETCLVFLLSILRCREIILTKICCYFFFLKAYLRRLLLYWKMKCLWKTAVKIDLSEKKEINSGWNEPLEVF